MKRKEFIEKLGLGAAFVLTSTCLGSCTADGSHLPDGPVDLSLDLDDPSYAALTDNGGYIITDGVVVARDISGNLIAATIVCSHEGRKEIIYKDEEWFCTAHNARFDLQGNGLNGNGEGGLTIYNTELNGSTLRIFS